jgi:2-alkyl-3-oxoalkanoate reductase
MRSDKALSFGMIPFMTADMEILVTGTSGFVGGAIGRFLRGRGHRVIGLSRRAPRLGSADVAIRHDLSRPLPDLPKVDAVIHAAALSAPWGHPAAFEAANVAGTRHALAIAARTGARFILISSSSVLYAPGDQERLAEDPAPLTLPVNDYARTKRAAEDLTRAYAGPWAILRPRAVYGVGDTVLFPRIARAARLRLLPRFRQDRPARGDLVSIDTLVRQVARALDREAEGTLHLIDPAPVMIADFVQDVLARLDLPSPALTLGVQPALRMARALEGVSRRTGWWEPPLTRFGVEVFTTTKTFDDSRTRALLGAPDIPTELALARFAHWWRDGARLDDPAMGRVGDDP